MILNWRLSQATFGADFPGNSTGEFPAEIPALNGKETNGSSRTPCWFVDLYAQSSEEDLGLPFAVLHMNLSFASNKQKFYIA